MSDAKRKAAKAAHRRPGKVAGAKAGVSNGVGRRPGKADSVAAGVPDGASRRRGAPEGNANARKHGFYADLYTQLEVEDLAVAAAAISLGDEIALLRVRIRRAAVNDLADLDAIGRACGRLTQMLKAQRILSGDALDQFEDVLSETLQGLTEELGLGLG